MSQKYRSTARAASLAEGGALVIEERADMTMQHRGTGYTRGTWLFLWEGITVPIAFVPAAPPPPPPEE